jgi:DNA oxidative demethylase
MQFKIVPNFLDRAEQESLLAQILEVVRVAPLFVPRLPRSGKPFSVRMTNCG